MYKGSRLNTEDMWNSDRSRIDLFWLTMYLQRFRLLMRVVRTDDNNAREKRRQYEKLAGIRDIFDSFVQNCQKHYIISEYATIDEKLEAFRGHCSFRQHIASKPNKYGIKIFALVDEKTYYTYNMEVYVGSSLKENFHKGMTQRVLFYE